MCRPHSEYQAAFDDGPLQRHRDCFRSDIVDRHCHPKFYQRAQQHGAVCTSTGWVSVEAMEPAVKSG